MRGATSSRGSGAWPDATFDGSTGYRSGSAGYGNGSAGSRTALRQRGNFGPGGEGAGRGTRAWPPGRPWTGSGGGRGGGRWGGGRRNWSGRPRSWGDRFMQWLRSGDWWRHWTWKKALGLLGGAVAGVIMLGVLVFFIIYAKTPIPTASELTANWQSSIVYYANGQQMGTFDNNVNGVSVDRLLLTTNQIPPVMTQAMTAAEDHHFYTEGGVSVTGLMRAAFQDAFGHGNLQGGSTITMQYAKNYYNGVNTGQNLSTKLKEIFIAMKLGHARSKSWVMTNYLNTVPFGPPAYTGLGAAALNYFGVNLTTQGATLTLSQAAMLAAMPNSPGFLNPNPSAGAGYTALKARWRYVLEWMVHDGNISQKVANAQQFPTLNPPPAGNGETGYTGYLMSMVEQQLEAPAADGGYGLTKQQVDTGGYRITTTFQPALVNALANSIQYELSRGQALGHPFQSYDRIGAVLEDPKTGAILAVYGGPGYGSPYCNVTSCWINMAESPEPVGSSFKIYVLSAAVNEGMNVFSSQLNGFSPIWIPEKGPSPAVTEATMSPTSPPQGVSPNAVGGYSGDIYYFKFDETNENSGKPLPVNVAAAISSDPAFEDLGHRDGIDNVINMAKAFGVGQSAFVQPCALPASQLSTATQPEIIQDCNDMTGPGYTLHGTAYLGNGMDPTFSPTYPNSEAAKIDGLPGTPAIALGENPLTPVEQATTMATLADDGVYHTPHVIGSVVQNNTTLPNHITTTQVLSPEAAADVDWALSFDNNMSGGTAEGSVSFRRGGVIGKTGTLGSGANASQAWFVGGTPSQDALSVALFTDSPATENLDNLAYQGGDPGSQGGAWPATIWNNFMTTEFGATPASAMFPTANGSPFVPWIQATATCQPQQGQGQQQGQSPTQQCTCPNGASQPQQQGQSPAQQCTCPNGPTSCGYYNTGNGGNGNGGQCPPFGQACPTASPSTTPCIPVFGHQCNKPPTPGPSTTAALISGSPSSNSRGSPAGLAVFLAEEATVLATQRTEVT